MRHTIRIRPAALAAAMASAGIEKQATLLRLTEISRTSLYDVMRDEQEPGGGVIGSLLAVLPATFDDLFEVVPRHHGVGRAAA
ncbi:MULTISPECIES: helix-turn-helix domain-containing protein [Actinosynnema]|uniref:Transcriptional regulator n=1 Tax=Actinosynnema pretiosum TaxID=42197 RepID=A0A290ZAZ4_9PSEU|nr:helix-turn-helix domain-containing protein [Actinosynnema pretiosum]ATE56166.1 transcriptional regulator [Actinosynnema pretiosum]MCP2098618.1 Cro/C1-type HTH DNA-binding domain-containing protein [Actinosynnema pretiosum]